MFQIKHFGNLILLNYQKLQQRYSTRSLVGLLGVAILFFFGDSLLPMFGHLLVLIWHIAEATIEHLLDKWFGIRHWHADFISFWTCTLIASFIGWRLTRKCCTYSKKFYQTCKCKWQAKSKRTRYTLLACATMALVFSNM